MEEIIVKPVYRTGETVGNIVATNEAIKNAPVAPTAITPEPTPTPTVETVTPTVTPESTSIVETPTPEPNTSNFIIPELDAPTPTVETPTPATVIQPPVKTWRDAVKDETERGEIVKELGISEFALEMDKHIKNGGDPADYLNAKAIDYNKISDESLLRDELKKQNPFANPTQVDLLFKRKYGISDEMLDEDKEFMELQQKSDAYKVRQERITEQSKFKIAAPIPTPQPQDNTAENQRQEQAARQWYADHEATKSLMTSKRVAISLGENGTFNFNVDRPELLMKAITDASTWEKLTSNKQGEPDVAKMQKIALYAANPEQFESDLVNYGKSLALPGLVREGQNISPTAKVIPVQGTDKTEKEKWRTEAKSSTIGGR